MSVTSAELLAAVPGWLPYEFPTHVRDGFTGSWARFRGQAQRWFLFAYRGPEDDAEVDLETEHREFSEWRWIALEDLPAKVIPFKRGVYERVVAEFGPEIARLRAAGELGPRR